MASGVEVCHLSRKAKPGTVPAYAWDVRSGKIDHQALEGTNAIVHLAGAGIAEKPWTKARKQEILESRTRSTALLYDAMRYRPHQVKTVVCASAIGYYGFGGDEEIFTEAHPAAKDFLASVVRAWEAEADKFQGLGIRLVKIRIGIVLSQQGGALKEMAKPVRWGLGAPLAGGNQYMSWIHITDLCRMFKYALENDALQGVYNGVSPNPVTNKAFTRAVAAALNKKIWLPPVPQLVLRLLLGEMADLVVKGSRVSADRILQAGFRFEFADLQQAVNDLLR